MNDDIKVVWDKEYWLATTENPPIHGIGRTREDAVVDYKVSLRELIEDLAEKPDTELSAYWLSVKKGNS
jgi:hypothetical protein